MIQKENFEGLWNYIQHLSHSDYKGTVTNSVIHDIITNIWCKKQIIISECLWVSGCRSVASNMLREFQLKISFRCMSVLKKNNISKITIRWAGSLVLFSVAYATGLEIERAEVDRMSRLKFLMKLVQHRHWRDKLVPKFTFSCWTKYHKNSLLPGSGTKVLSLLGQSRLVTLRWPGEDQRVSLSAFHFQT